MATVEKLSIALTSEVLADVRQAIATGEYVSTSELIRDALRFWKYRRQERGVAIGAFADSGERALKAARASLSTLRISNAAGVNV